MNEMTSYLIGLTLVTAGVTFLLRKRPSPGSMRSCVSKDFPPIFPAGNVCQNGFIRIWISNRRKISLPSSKAVRRCGSGCSGQLPRQ